MFKFLFRILKLTIAATIVILTVAYAGYYLKGRYVDDPSSLKQASEALNWVENFYTLNSHYPSQADFKNQFPNFDPTGKYGYTAYGLNNQDQNPAQNFTLFYELSSERSDVPGVPSRPFGYEGYYKVGPCPRWARLGLKQPEIHTYVSPGGLIHSDLNAGEIYFTYSERPNEKVPLLSGLDKPRLFQGGGHKITITNGDDVISYEWDGFALKLKNPKKIGTVPTGCPASY